MTRPIDEEIDRTRRKLSDQEKVKVLREALKVMIYEVTHLAPGPTDNAYRCVVDANAVTRARASCEGTSLRPARGLRQGYGIDQQAVRLQDVRDQQGIPRGEPRTD